MNETSTCICSDVTVTTSVLAICLPAKSSTSGLHSSSLLELVHINFESLTQRGTEKGWYDHFLTYFLPQPPHAQDGRPISNEK
jgi:hypothetical protein